MGAAVVNRAEQFEPVEAALAARWQRFATAGDVRFPQVLGLTVTEVRHGYCRMRMPYRPELRQGGGIVHGGAIASLLDSVMVPAIGVTLPPKTGYSTVDLHVQFLDAVADGDIVAEGWIVRQGRRTVFGQAEAFAEHTGRLVARAISTFAVRPPD